MSCDPLDNLAETKIAFAALGVLTASSGFANPTASVGLTAVNGTATTGMRSDAAPPLDQSIAPTWSGLHTFERVITFASDATSVGFESLSASQSTQFKGVSTLSNPYRFWQAVNGVASSRAFSFNVATPGLTEILRMNYDGSLLAYGDLSFNAVTDQIAGIQNQNLLDKTAAESISGVYTFTVEDVHNVGLTVGDGTDTTRAISFNTGSDHNFQYNAVDERFEIPDDTIAVNPSITGASNTPSSTICLDIFGTFSPDSTGGNNAEKIGVNCEALYADGGAQATVDGVNGGRFRGNFTKNTATVTNLVGGDFQVYMTRGGPTSVAHTVTNAIAGDFSITTTGWRYTITDARGVRVKAATALGTATTISDYVGVLVEDLAGRGTTNQAVQVNSQSGSSATKGNVYCAGGDWNNGHLQLNTGHFWATSGDIRFKGGTPTGATDYDVAITSTEVEINGNLNHDGSNIGFFGTAPAAQAAAYTPTNVSTDRSFDANATSIDELADVLGTLISDLQSYGLLQ